MTSIPDKRPPLAAWLVKSGAVVLRYLAIFVVAFTLFGVILWIAGKDPWLAIRDTLTYTLGSGRGLSEVVVKMTPLLLTALAVAVPSRVMLINIGSEGQLYMGACLGTWVALSFTGLPAWVMLPFMLFMGAVGGALWALVPAILRARGLVNETITTLLLNYVAPSLVTFFIYGPWRSPGNSFYPQTLDFVPAARLPLLGDTRIHLGLVVGLVMLGLYWLLMKYTRWGLEMRAIGGNAQAAKRSGIPVTTYLILALCIGGALAGVAGIAEVAGAHGRLRPGFSPGFGYTGFLINWLAGGHPLGILVMAFVVALITSGGDILQINQGLPFAVVDILLAITLFVVLARPALRLKGKRA